MESNTAVLNIGNTRSLFGFFSNNKIIYTTYMLDKAEKYIIENAFTQLFTITVNSDNFKKVEQELNGKIDIVVLEKKKEVIVSKYNIDQIGIDRYMNIYYAIKNNIYPSVIMDLGTADTFDYIDENGTHLGGLITPGLQTLFKSVSRETEKLSELKPQFRDIIYGIDTETALEQGIYGQWLMTAINYSSLLKNKYDRQLRILVTGGNAIRIKDFIPSAEIDMQFTLKGIRDYAEEFYNE